MDGTMASQQTSLKHIVAGRRKPNMTRAEYLDYHFRIHGALADEIEDPALKPYKYNQIHIIDGAYGGRSSSPTPNANHAWCNRDDVTELFFSDWTHLRSTYTSSHVTSKVGPDGLNFADFESAISLVAIEKPLTLSLGGMEGAPPKTVLGSSTDNVAMLFLALPDGSCSGAQIEETLSPQLVKVLHLHAANYVFAVIANIGIDSVAEFDHKAYFGGVGVPTYALVYKIFTENSVEAVKAVRKAQSALYESAGSSLDLHSSFIVFGVEGLILDTKAKIKFSSNRQPKILS